MFGWGKLRFRSPDKDVRYRERNTDLALCPGVDAERAAVGNQSCKFLDLRPV